MAWKIKQNSNDELRQKFVDQTVPQADVLGLRVPDPGLVWDAEAGHYRFGAIDWQEFYDVLKSGGQCGAERLAARQKAWDDGAWFRDGLAAHATKHARAAE